MANMFVTYCMIIHSFLIGIKFKKKALKVASAMLTTSSTDCLLVYLNMGASTTCPTHLKLWKCVLLFAFVH